MQETWVQSLGWEDPLEKGTATHSSILAWRIPWTVYSAWGRQELDTTERLSFSHSLTPGNQFVFYVCNYSCFVDKFICTIFVDSTRTQYHIFVFDFLHSFWQSLASSISLQMALFFSFLWLIIFHCISVPHLLYSFICWWTFRLLPYPGYCKQCFSEHLGGMYLLELWFSPDINALEWDSCIIC